MSIGHLLLIACYLVPSFVAWRRKHVNVGRRFRFGPLDFLWWKCLLRSQTRLVRHVIQRAFDFGSVLPENVAIYINLSVHPDALPIERTRGYVIRCRLELANE